MYKDLIQDIRYKLHKRIRKIKHMKLEDIKTPILHLWNFLNNYSFIIGILEELELLIQKDNLPIISSYGDKTVKMFKTEIENAAFIYSVVRDIGQNKASSFLPNFGMNSSVDNRIIFKDIYIDFLYDYIDEKLDNQSFMLALLIRYKHKCEWFQKHYLHSLQDVNKNKEKKLALHLYDYLYDQGLDITIEPNNLEGKPDLIAAQNSEDPLLADAKVFDGNKSYLIKGFGQIYRYTLRHCEPFGYLIIYKVCEKDLSFALPMHSQIVPYIVHNNKTIFFIVIDLFSSDKSPSQRGALKPCIIKEEELITSLKKVDEESD